MLCRTEHASRACEISDLVKATGRGPLCCTRTHGLVPTLIQLLVQPLGLPSLVKPLSESARVFPSNKNVDNGQDLRGALSSLHASGRRRGRT